jgi:hypothetical protein
MYLIVCSSLCLIGGVLILRGARGRPINDRALCASCRYEVSGVLLAGPGAHRCPECGTVLDAASNTIITGERRPHSMQLCGGMALVACGAGVMIMRLLLSWLHMDVTSLMPSGVVEHLAKGSYFGGFRTLQ